MMQYLLGFDIGGTKCAVNTARWDGERIVLLRKAQCATDHRLTPEEMLDARGNAGTSV